MFNDATGWRLMRRAAGQDYISTDQDQSGRGRGNQREEEIRQPCKRQEREGRLRVELRAIEQT